jgi:hypothetical protein
MTQSKQGWSTINRHPKLKLPQRRTTTKIDQPFGGPYPAYMLSGYSWGIPGSAEVLTALPPYSLIVTLPKSVLRLLKEFQNKSPLVISVVPDTNSRKDIQPSVTSDVRPLSSQPDSCNKRFETVYRSTSPLVLAAVKSPTFLQRLGPKR